jgi:hypothetical protein
MGLPADFGKLIAEETDKWNRGRNRQLEQGGVVLGRDAGLFFSSRHGDHAK